MGCASSRLDVAVDSDKQRRSSTTASTFTDLSSVDCVASVAAVQPGIWAVANTLVALPSQPPAPAALGSLVSLHGVPNHADGTGAGVMDVTDSGELELRLEDASAGDAPLRVGAANPATSRLDIAVDSDKQRRSSTTTFTVTDLSSVDCAASTAVFQPGIWAVTNALGALPHQPPAPATTGSLFSQLCERCARAFGDGLAPGIWAVASALDELPPQSPAPATTGSLVSLHGVPNHADGTGAEVVAVTDSGELELRLEDASAGDAPLRVSATNATTLPAFPANGVSLACLRAFREAHASELTDKTTSEVCESVIKPIARRARASLADLLERIGAADPGTGRPFVGRATLFVSHAWKYTFTQLLDAVEAHVGAMPAPDSVYLWLDMFVVNQHANTEKPKIWWTVTFREAIRSIGATCLVLAPWDAPIPLTRAWCIWEIASVLQTKTALDIALAPAEAVAFEKALVEDFASIATSLSRVDVRNAEAFILADRDMILRVAEETVGLSKLNQLVLGRMREWLAGAGRGALARLPGAERGTSGLLSGVAGLLRNQGKLDEAEPLWREAFEARREVLGARHPNTLASMNNLALLLADQGKLDEAEPLYRETLEARREVLGARHPGTLASMNNLAILLKDQGKLDEAETLYRETLEATREVLGARHPDTLGSMNNLAGLLQSQGKLDEAEPLYRETLEATREVLGARHPSTLASMNNLAGLLLSQGKLDEAEPLYRETLEAKREVLGARHPGTLASMNNLANLLKDQGKLDEAEPLYRETLEALREVLGARHPSTFLSMNNLAVLLVDQGKLDEAEPLYRETLEARREVLGARHPDTLGSMNNLANLIKDQGKMDQAEPLYRETLEARREVLGARHPDTLGSMNNLANLLKDQGKLDEAEPLYRETLEARREVLGARHPDTLRSMNNLANLLQNQGKPDEAEPLWREVLKAGREVLGSRHPSTLGAMNILANLLQNQGKPDEAEPLWREVLKASREVLGARHPSTLQPCILPPGPGQ